MNKLKKSKLIFLIILLGFIKSFCQSKGYINDSDGYTNLRKEPSKESDIIGVILSGQELNYYPNNSNWYKVDFIYRTGYVHKSRIKSAKTARIEVKEFLQKINSSNNIERSQTNNKKLLEYIQKFPIPFFEAFEEENENKQNYILKEVETPVSDLINLQTVYGSLSGVDFNPIILKKIKKALKRGAHKSNITLIDSYFTYKNIPEVNIPKRTNLSTNTSFVSKLKNKSITYYLNHPKVNPYAKLFYQGQFSLSDNDETFDLFDLILDKNKDLKPFYFYVYSSATKVSDGAVSEVIGVSGFKYLESCPCQFLKDYKDEFYKNIMFSFVGSLGFEIYDMHKYNIVHKELKSVVELNCPDLLKDLKSYMSEVKKSIVE